MTTLARFARGVWEFIVGDDWRVAAGVVVALGVTAAAGAEAWWIMPVAVILLLAASLWHASRRAA